ncbi:MAG: protein-export chaperone SecB [Xanthomonadales bacterium]|nr:protein-export chaperone SecB [Xanthomonadales bacterium]
MSEEEQPEAQTEGDKKIIRPQKIYLKDVSFESPNSPELFTRKWAPKLAVEMNHSASMLEDDIYEVILAVTTTVSIEDKTAFLAEVHQAGIFVLKGHEPDALQRLQQVYCLNTLYPYVCTALSDLVTKGGFPQLLLAPIDFRAMYAKNIQKDSDQDEAADG